ncbi:signal peptidase II [Bdellovibrio sp. qaytius]|nr:signal peptidase II [Bdellovibrio sp. qaytius]
MDNLKTSHRLFILFLILITVVAVDQWTKVLAVQHLAGKAPIMYFGGLFQFIYAENPGAFLGMGGELPQSMRFVIFGLFVLLGLVVMLWSLVKNKMNLSDLLAYSFILAGGIGNVIDRLSHTNGHVIDFMFMDFQFAPFARTGVFNVADMAIVLGFFIAIFGMIRERINMHQHSVG